MTSLSSLLPLRIINLLTKHNLHEIEKLTLLNARELQSLQGIGGKTVDEIKNALTSLGHELAHDPFAPYLCVRHGEERRDSSLESFFLCDSCAEEFTLNAFRNNQPVFIGEPLEGHCLHCNEWITNIRIRQWHICNICNRVVRSIGRSKAANNAVIDWWTTEIAPTFPHLDFRLTDPPELRPRGGEPEDYIESHIDFVCYKRNGDPYFGIELKTGTSHPGSGDIGTAMSQFQLDNSDCDDIIRGVRELDTHVYLIHSQVINRSSPPTTFYVAVGLWWTDLFSMRDHHQVNRQRPRENRIAAYYNTRMFNTIDGFLIHLGDQGPNLLNRRLKEEDIPALY